MKIEWDIHISFDPTVSQRPQTGGLFTRSAECVQKYATVIGCNVHASGPRRSISIKLEEGSSALMNLLSEIEADYGFRHFPGFIVPEAMRSDHFMVLKYRSYSEEELGSADYLSLAAGQLIGWWSEKITEAQILSETYVVDARRYHIKKLELGCIFPTDAFAVASGMRARLESGDFCGLRLDPVIVVPERSKKRDLWKLGSSITLPPSELKIVTSDGSHVNVSDSWNMGYFDDAGYLPIELRYSRDNFEAIGPFDIAMTAERLGRIGPEAASRAESVRRVVVSQRLRQFIVSQKIRGVGFSSVRLVGE